MISRSARDLASLGYRRAAAAWGALTGGTARTLDSIRGCAGILMYHRVLPDRASSSGIEPGMYVRASAFERQIEWLVKRWRVRTLGEVVSRPPSPDEPPVAVITFDDGWRDNLTVAWPILRRHGVGATIFVVRDWVAAGRNAEGEFLRPEELEPLVAEGAEIGAHTVSHPRLDRLDDSRAEIEMQQSKDAVERWTGRPCELFAYPYGAHTSRTAEIARRMFRATVVVGGGWWKTSRDADLARLPRIGVHQDRSATPDLFKSLIAGHVR